MSFQKIPVRSDLPAYEFDITLDGKIYNLSFSWNDRTELWTMDILDETGKDLLLGVSMFTNWDLIGRFRSSELPEKKFFCVDTAGEGKNPGIDDFGSRVILVYGDDT